VPINKSKRRRIAILIKSRFVGERGFFSGDGFREKFLGQHISKV